MKKTVDTHLLSDYRDEIKGLCALAIILSHAPGNDVVFPAIVAKMLGFGGYGVDVFLLLAGMGFYHSINKEKIISYKAWIQDRLIKLIVPTIIVAFPLRLILTLIRGGSIASFLIFFTTIPYWLYHNGDWFVEAMIICIFITPFLHILQKKTNNKFIWMGLLLIICLIGNSSIDRYLTNSIKSVVENMQFIMARLPNFVLGFCLGRKIQQHEYVHLTTLLVGPAVTFLIFSNPVLHIHVGWLLSFTCAILVSICLQYINKCLKFVRVALKHIGSCSLESYLANVYLGPILSLTILYNVDNKHWVYYSLVIILGLIYAIISNRISKIVTKKMLNSRRRKC